MLPAARLRNLVLVAGHAVYVGSNYAEARVQQSWFLEEYQRVPGEVESFLDHIRIGVELASSDPLALLLFSGGQTRLAAGPRSEGLSYWVVAEAAGWFNRTEVRGRAFTEEHARDSFENMLFGMCRFYELTGHYPQSVTIVSYTLKQQRFETLHRAALRYPLSKFRFIGTPIPPDATGASAGEAMTVASFTSHPYGCDGDLMLKRMRRDPFAVGPIHPSRCPDLRGLLGHCGDELFTGPLPWDHLHLHESIVDRSGGQDIFS
ncbi:MAG: hypothetical protein WDW36_001937 [Sanguina aurantia]